MVTTIEPDRVTNDWVLLATIRQRSLAARVGHSARVDRGRHVLA